MKDPKGVYPKMPVQLFQEEVFKKDQPGSYFFKNFNLEEEQLYEVMSAIADKEKKQELQNGMKLIKWLILGWNNLEV
jgi:glycine betaine/proline transport system substrate-binding protein